MEDTKITEVGLTSLIETESDVSNRKTEIIQYSDFGQLIGFDASSIKIHRIRSNTITKKDNKDILLSGKGNGKNSTTVDPSKSSLMVCSRTPLFPVSIEDELNNFEELSISEERSILLNSVKEEDPFQSTVLLIEESTGLIKVRVLYVSSFDDTVIFEEEYSYTVSANSQLSSCSDFYFSIANPNGSSDIYDIFSGTLIRNFPITNTVSDLMPIYFLSSESFIRMVKTDTAGDYSYEFYHNVDQGTPTKLQNITSNSASSGFQGALGGGFFASDVSSRTPLVNVAYEVTNYTDTSILTRSIRLREIPESKQFTAGISKGMVFFLSNSTFELIIPQDNDMMDSGNDHIRYQVTRTPRRFYKPKPLPENYEYKGLIFDTYNTSQFFLVAKDTITVDSPIKLMRGIALDLIAECKVTDSDIENYAEEIPLFYGETLEGRFGYKNSFSFLLTTQAAEKTGFNSTVFVTFYLMITFVIVLAIGIYWVCKAGKYADSLKKI